MPIYLLDSGPLSAYLLGYSKAVALVSPWIANREVATSDLAYAEVYELLQSFPDAHNQSMRLLSIVTGTINAFSLDFSIYRRYAEIRRHLRPRNELIGDIDTLIAATAFEKGLTIVTNNERHFNRVPGLNVVAY
jgi:predicted nucleic acid-binding protein